MGHTKGRVRALRTKENQNPNRNPELRQTSAVDANQFCLFWERREREREFFLLSWKDASRSTERRFHQEGRGRQPPICEPVRGDVPQRPRARGRRREVRPGRERARDPARSRHALVLRQLHPLLWSRV